MKRIVTRLISILLVTVMCISALPVEVFAWGKMTHVYTANMIEGKVMEGKGEIAFLDDEGSVFEYDIPDEYYEAIMAYPDAFRAGSLGPDVYPDIFTGQVYIHPEDGVDNPEDDADDPEDDEDNKYLDKIKVDSGMWIAYLCDAVNKLPEGSEDRKMCLSFTLGCMLHYCGDLFGHDFVNTFSGGAFPSFFSTEILDLKSERLNNILSHLSIESYMDDIVYPTYNADRDGGIDGPDKFISGTMVFDGSPAIGLNPIYEGYPYTITENLDKFQAKVESIWIVGDLLGSITEDIIDDLLDKDGNNVPPHYTAVLKLREFLTSTADEYREYMDPVSAAITLFCDRWAEDVDEGIVGLSATCDRIARRLVTGEKNPEIEKKTQEERLEEQNKIWTAMGLDMDELNMKVLINILRPDLNAEQTEKEFNEVGIYGDSFFDTILVELVLIGAISMEMLDTNGSAITIIKEELSYWMDEYGNYMLFIPDFIIDGIEIPIVGDLLNIITEAIKLPLYPIFEIIKGEIKALFANWVICYCTGLVSDATGWEVGEIPDNLIELVEYLFARLEDPEVQLDHEDNPYRPTENNFEDLKEYMDVLEDEAKYNIADSDFEALYNTITMFQLVLMGPENYSKFIKKYAGVDQTDYQMNTGAPEVTSLKVRIKTADLFLAGTDNNIYLVVERVNADGSRDEIKSKLLDFAAHNDFEQGDMQTYIVELPCSVKLSQLEIGLRKTIPYKFSPGISDDWVCESIRVTPMYAGYELTAPIELGGVSIAGTVKGTPLRLNFQDAMNAKTHKNPKKQEVTNLKIEIKVKDELYAGTDSDIYLKAIFGDTYWKSVLLDKGEGHNDLEKGETEVYNISITNSVTGTASGIPLDQLSLEFRHTGTDEAIWEEVKITPCFGSLELTDPISLGGQTFEETTWAPDFQKALKKATYRTQEPSLSQTANTLYIQINVANELGAGTDDYIYLHVYSKDGTELLPKLELDNADWYNDFEQGASDIYTVFLYGDASQIPLDQLRLVFERERRLPKTDEDGDLNLLHYKDEAKWDEVLVTAYKGSQKLTDTISLGGTEFDDDLWDTDFATKLKQHYTPIVFEYETNMDGGLLAYMDSLDSGEEWVDKDNTLWTNPTVRSEVFLKIFKGFAPEIEFDGPITVAQGKGINLDLSFTGMWNGVSMDRRSQVKDFEHNPAVEGTATISIINARGSAVCTVKDIPVADNTASLKNYTNNILKPGTYDLKVKYTPASKNQMYSATEVVFKQAITVTGASEFTVKVNASPTTAGTVTGGGTYKNSASVTVTATPKSSYEFKEWTKNGQTVSTSASYSFLVQEDCTLYAVFVPKMEESFYVTINDGKSTAEAMVGETIRLDAKVTGGMEPYKYQWYVRENGKTTWQKSGSAGSMSTMILDATLGNNGRTFKVEVTDPFGKQTSSNEVTIVVNEPVAEMKIKTQPDDITVGEGNTAVFFVEVTGGRAPYTYHWQMPSANSWTNIKDSATYSGLGTNTLAFKASKNSITQVRCIVMDSDGNDVTSRVAKLTVTEVTPLTITKQPSNSNVKPGTAVSLTVEVSGGKAPYTYTWQRFDNRWENVTASSQYSGLGTATLSFTPSTAGTTQFRCVIKDNAGNEVTSNAAQVNAIADPLLITQPSSATIDLGASASLKVGASGGTAPYTYSWQINMGSKWSPVANNSLYSGQGTDTLTVKPNKAGTTEFRCVVKDSGGKEITSVTVKVTAVEVAPLVVKTQPKDAEIEIGSMTILTVAADGGKAPYSYSWQIRTGDSWAIIRDSLLYFGQGTDTLVYMPNTAGTAEIRCLISDSAGNSILSSTAYIKAKEATTQLTITNQPSSATTDVGKTVSFMVGVSGGKAPYQYLWQLDGGNGWYTFQNSDEYAGQGTNILRYTPKYGETVRIRCMVYDSAGNSVTSNAATLTVNASDPLVIDKQPRDTKVSDGMMLGLQVVVSGGTEPYTYQWQGSDDGINWIDIKNTEPGIDDADTWYVCADSDQTSFYKYARCVITDAAGQSVTSRVATVTIVRKLAVQINNGETEFTVSYKKNETMTLTANVTGGEGTYTYKWYVKYDGSDRWIEWATTSSYEVIARNISDRYRFKVEVKDSTGKKATSQEVTIKVPDQPVN